MKNCGSCKELKESSEFYKNKLKKDGLGSYCKKCNTLWIKQRYQENKSYYDEKNRLGRERNKKYLLDYLKSHPCIDCGEKDPVVLEFDHLSDKKYVICTMVTNICSLKTIQDEINKCEVRCANCHRRKTAKSRNYYKFVAS